jgi:ribosomal protein S18 acetylase RimI-like enzyme
MTANDHPFSQLTVRKATLHDKQKIYQLYLAVSRLEGGIARTQKEVTEDWVLNCLLKGLSGGFVLVIDHPEKPEELIATLHTYSTGLQAFSHVLGDLTIGVHPDFQGQGVGRRIFERLLRQIEEERPDILRVELIVRESNKKAIRFYEQIGFTQEGRLERRIHNTEGRLEADIPMAWFNSYYQEC